MKKPTLEEVREHFKDAELVKYLVGDNIAKIETEKIDLDGFGYYVAKDLFSDTFLVLWQKGYGYAEIVKYKNQPIPQDTPQEPKTPVTIIFETVSGVKVRLKGKNIENLKIIYKQIGQS